MIHNDTIIEPLPSISLAKGGIKNDLSKNENKDLMYFMIEINVETQRMELIGPKGTCI